MSSPGGVAHAHDVLLAGAPAVAIAGAGGKEPAEDAMLRMENRQVLVGDSLDPVAPNLASQLADLSGIQVVGGSKRRESQGKEFGSRDRICGVEAEIADQLAGG